MVGMRTRARGPISPPPSSPPRVTGRKRTSTSTSASEETPAGEKESDDHALNPKQDHQQRPSTPPPRKPKRVRFSDPGPIKDDNIGLGITSSGLTPHMNRTTLNPGEKSNIQPTSILVHANRRSSLPAVLTDPSSPIVQKIQFEPLRQILDQRLRRRLRRSHLSEEMNNIEDEKREETRNRQELEKLRNEGGLQEERIKELIFEVEAQKQLGIVINNEEEERMEALEDELRKLREELANKTDSNQEASTHLSEGFLSSSNDGAEFHIFEDETATLGPSNDEDEDVAIPDSPSQHCRRLTSISPSSSFTKAMGDTNPNDLPSPALTEPDTPATQPNDTTICIPPSRVDLGASLQSLNFLAPGSAPASIITALKSAFRTSRYELERLLPGETEIGFDNTAELMPTLLSHIRFLLADLEASRNSLSQVRQTEGNLRSNFNATLEKLGHAENGLTIIHAEKESLASQVKTKERLIADLETAAKARISLIDLRDYDLKNMRLALDQTVAELEAATTAKDTLKDELEKLQATHDRESKEASRNHARLTTALSTTREEADALLALLTTTESTNNTLNTQNIDLATQLCALQTQLHEQSSHFALAAEDHAAALRSLEGENAGLRALVQMAREKWQGQILRTRTSLEGLNNEFNNGVKEVEEFVGAWGAPAA